MKKENRLFSDAEKLLIIEEYMNSGESMETFQVKNGMGHCTCFLTLQFALFWRNPSVYGRVCIYL